MASLAVCSDLSSVRLGAAVPSPIHAGAWAAQAGGLPRPTYYREGGGGRTREGALSAAPRGSAYGRRGAPPTRVGVQSCVA